MANNLPTVRRFRIEDFPGAESWFAQFLNSLNLYTDPVYQILDGGVGSQNLISPKTFTKVITAPASGSTTFSFTNPLTVVPTAVWVGNVYVNGNPSSHPSSPVNVFWHFSQGTIYIDDVTNLTASTTYSLTLIVLGE